MLRCSGRQALRLISRRRVTARAGGAGEGPASVHGGISSSSSSSSTANTPINFARQRIQSRSASSWLRPNQIVAAAESGGGSGNFGIATGLELEELEAQQKGKKRFDLDPPQGPFGTKNHPAIVESQFDERIVGCSGGTGEDEHDVTWFKLKKGEVYECPVCTQYFELKVVGEGGLPGAHH